MSGFAQQFLIPFTAKTRRTLTQQMIEKGEMSDNFKAITVSWDGTHRL